MDFTEIPTFVAIVESALTKSLIDVSHLELDHICYRVKTIDEYNLEKNYLSQVGLLLNEVEIGGRPIATYKLQSPILAGSRPISVIELPSPKPGSPYETGFEHVEYVTHMPLEKFILEYPQVDWDLRAFHKKTNRDVSVQFTNFAVKFHEKRLEDVIKYEQTV